jgi:hypothetical protein
MNGYNEDEWEDSGVLWESDFDPFDDLPEAEAAALLEAMSVEWLAPNQVARVTHGSDTGR